MTYWVTVQRVALAILFGAIMVGLALLFAPKCRELYALHQNRQLRQQENDQLKTSIDELRDNIDKFQNDPAYVERVARGVGMVKPGEVKVILKETNGTPCRPQETGNEKPKRR